MSDERAYDPELERRIAAATKPWFRRIVWSALLAVFSLWLLDSVMRRMWAPDGGHHPVFATVMTTTVGWLVVSIAGYFIAALRIEREHARVRRRG